MRWNLQKTYDKIYTLDLHGNAKKKETCPDGSSDVNVFDIMQGVSINIFVKTGKKKTNELGKVFHYDLYGKRELKYDFLIENSLKTIPYKELQNVAPNYFMVQKDFESEENYNKGIVLNNLFLVNNVGIVSSRDGFVVADNKKELEQRLNSFFNLERQEILNLFNVRENKTWKIEEVQSKAKQFDSMDICSISYRPFDNKYLYNNPHFIERSRNEVMQHFRNTENIGLVIGRQGQVVGDMPWNLSFITNSITDFNLYYRGGGNLFPLYLYPETNGQITTNTQERTPNLNTEIVNQIADKLGLIFINEKDTSSSSASESTFAPIDILDYIYAVLHSPTYREKYKEFLKIDFPRVPYPKDAKTFWKLVKLGREIRQIHLLESPIVEDYITQYPINGDNVVGKTMYQDNKVYINYDKTTHSENGELQYFSNVPLAAWEFYIGGYQPAQKWLKDRKGRTLNFEDILHYQKIIVALSETNRLMKEIDKIEIG